MLVNARGKNIVRDYAGTTKCDAVSSDVEEDVSRLENHTSQTIGLFISYEREPAMAETAIEDVLTSDKSVAFTSWYIGICSALWRRSGADFDCDLAKRDNGPAMVVLDSASPAILKLLHRRLEITICDSKPPAFQHCLP